MPPSRPVDIAEEVYVALDELRAVLEAVIPRPLEPAIGIKQVDGEYQDDLALVVLVPEMLHADGVPPGQLVPEQFAGFVTDVVQFRPTEISDQTAYDPPAWWYPDLTPPRSPAPTVSAQWSRWERSVPSLAAGSISATGC